MFRTLPALARSGLTAVLLHPLRSATAVACVVAVLVPYVAGAAIARGARAAARAAIEAGPELQVSTLRFGRPVPTPLGRVDEIRSVPGVRRVVPRIVGELALGAALVPVVLVGVPPDELPAPSSWPATAGGSPEFLVGPELARRLELETGSLLPPFYRGKAGDRVSRIVGVLPPDSGIASGHVMLTSFATAAEVFGEENAATDLLVTCQPGLRDAVRRRILQRDASFRVTTREELAAQLPESLRHLDGVFQIHFALAFAVGIPLLLVASGVGLVERRREAALLKATGWRTDELLVRAFVESLVLCAIATSLAVLGSWAWLRFGDGAGLAGVFLPGWEWGSALQVPYRLGFEGALVGAILSLCIVATGSLYATWRVATAPAGMVLR